MTQKRTRSLTETGQINNMQPWKMVSEKEHYLWDARSKSSTLVSTRKASAGMLWAVFGAVLHGNGWSNTACERTQKPAQIQKNPTGKSHLWGETL